VLRPAYHTKADPQWLRLNNSLDSQRGFHVQALSLSLSPHPPTLAVPGRVQPYAYIPHSHHNSLLLCLGITRSLSALELPQPLPHVG
jgi:hypothetical protein